MSTPKELGNAAFKQKDFDKAVEHYSRAIIENPDDHTIYGNRSASYHNLKNYDAALQDGNKCVELKPDWDKGHQRKAMALHGLKMYPDAMAAYEDGYKINSNN